MPSGRRQITLIEWLRLGTSVVLVALGLVIVAQGVILAAPWTYTLTGVLMAGLGLYRLRLAWVLWSRPAPRGDRPARGRGDGRGR